MKRLVVGCIGVYRIAISPFLASSCRYYPSCSVYCQEAVERYGVRAGLRMALHRIARCHPWSEGGYDPVP
jgi:putative membrane protein insertion efficiency factor